MLSIDLKGHLALVTGGSGQLGRVMVRTLAKCGAGVVIHYHHNQENALSLLEEVRALGVPGMVVQADVTVLEDVRRMKAEIEKELGAQGAPGAQGAKGAKGAPGVQGVLSTPDIIVNNAVIQYKWVGVLEQGAEDYESQFRSCVLHNVYMAQTFVPAMVAKKWGRVIAINTECSMQNFPTQSAYVSGKRGMDGVLRVLAKEVGEHQVTVNQVAPGWMISEKSPSRLTDLAYTRNVPLKRRGTDQDVANLVAFLASGLAGFITGQYISVSGGNVMPAI